MTGKEVVEVPPPPVSLQKIEPLETEVGKDMSTPRTSATRADTTETTQESKEKRSGEKCLPGFAVVPELEKCKRIEERQNRLGSLTNEILLGRDKAMKNAELRAAGKPAEETVSDQNRPNDTTTEKPREYNESNFAEAKEQARKEGKSLYLDFHIDRCPHCDDQDRYLADPKVQELLKNAIFVKIDGRRAPQLAHEYGVRGYPTTVIQKPDQNPVYKHPGAVGPEELIKVLNTALK